MATEMIADKWRIPCTIEGLKPLAGLWGFKIHGDTATEIDIEFPNIAKASSFVGVMEDHGWSMRLRDAVTRFDVPVTVIITKYVHWNGRTFGQLSATEQATASALALNAVFNGIKIREDM